MPSKAAAEGCEVLRLSKAKAGIGPYRTTVIPGAAPPRPRLGRGRRIFTKDSKFAIIYSTTKSKN